MSIFPCWLDVMYPERSFVCGTRISRAFDLKQEAHLRWTRERSRVNWEEFVCCQVSANEVYSEPKRQFGIRNIDVLMNVQSPHKWWSTLKSAVFGSSSSLPPLVRVGDCV